LATLVNNAPTIIGSLTQLLVADGSLNFNVGDTVDVTSSSGRQATARVAATVTQSGLIEFTLLTGGWGYTANAQVLISDVVLSLVNIVRPITTSGPTLQLFLDMTQGSLPFEA
jgi:hypothetical protein